MPIILAVEVNRGRGLGPFVRCAVAFGAKLLLVIGSSHFGTHGAHGSEGHINTVHFFDWDDVMPWLRRNNYDVFVISPKTIRDTERSSRSIEDMQFSNPNVVFIMGDGENLSHPQRSLGDALIHVPCADVALEHLVRYEAKLAICLHHFVHQQLGHVKAHVFEGEKYIIGETMAESAINARSTTSISTSTSSCSIGACNSSQAQIPEDRGESQKKLATGQAEYMELKILSKSMRYHTTSKVLDGTFDCGSGVLGNMFLDEPDV